MNHEPHSAPARGAWLAAALLSCLDPQGKLAQGSGWPALPVLAAVVLILLPRPATIKSTD